MDITITVRDGWALVTDEHSGRTAICEPTITENSMHFELRGWHTTYEEAFLVLSAMNSVGKDLPDIDVSQFPKDWQTEGLEYEQPIDRQVITATAHDATADDQ